MESSCAWGGKPNKIFDYEETAPRQATRTYRRFGINILPTERGKQDLKSSEGILCESNLVRWGPSRNVDSVSLPNTSSK